MDNFSNIKPPKITQGMISKSPEVGKPVGFKKKLHLLYVFGSLSDDRTAKKAFLKQGYEWDTSDQRGSLDRRIDNLCRDTYQLCELDLDFLYYLFFVAFGFEAMESITKQDVLSDDSLLLCRKILGQNPKPDWSNVDPLSALLEISTICEPILFSVDDTAFDERMISLEKKKEDEEKILYDDDFDTVFTQDSQFKLYMPDAVEKAGTSSKPLVLNYSEKTGIDSKGKSFRAQVIETVTRNQPRSGPWKIAKEGNLPLTVRNLEGRFGIIAISGLGNSVETLFGDQCEPCKITNEELSKLYTLIAANAASGSLPQMGVFRYRVDLS